MVSLVVPAMVDIMALSFFIKALSKEDLPTLGLPIIATSIPLNTSFIDS